jgi:hypothetical protein
MLEKFKIGTSAAILIGLSACNLEIKTREPAPVENPELCSIQAPYITQFEKDIKSARPLLPLIVKKTAQEVFITNVSTSSETLPTGTEITKIHIRYVSGANLLGNFSGRYKIPTNPELKLSFYEEDINIPADSKEQTKQNTPDNLKIVIRRQVNGELKEKAVCKEVDFSKK